MLKTLEHDLSEAVATLREKVARLQSDVAYLSDGQRAHSGSQVRTDQQLAHISTSLREVHVLISRMQRDVDCLGSAKTTTKSLPETFAIWWPALLGIVALAAVIMGKNDLAAKLSVLK